MSNTFRDNWGRRRCHVVAMDASYFSKKALQFKKDMVDRELQKAYAAFLPLHSAGDFRYPIATGNWGCGAFNGDRELKGRVFP